MDVQRRVAPFLVLVAMAWSSTATAQTVNIESLTRDKPGFGFALAGSLSISSGNVVQTVGSATTHAQYQIVRPDEDPEDDVPAYLHHRWMTTASIGYESAREETVQNNRFAHARWTAMWHERIGSEMFGQYQFKEFARLQARILSGVGPRANLVHLKTLKVQAGTAYMFEYEQLQRQDPNDPKPDPTVAHRWSNLLTIELASVEGILAVANTVYVQPRFDDFSDYRLLDEVAIDIRVTEVLSIGSAIGVAYDSEPPAGVENKDITFEQTFKLTF